MITLVCGVRGYPDQMIQAARSAIEDGLTLQLQVREAPTMAETRMEKNDVLALLTAMVEEDEKEFMWLMSKHSLQPCDVPYHRCIPRRDEEREFRAYLGTPY